MLRTVRETLHHGLLSIIFLIKQNSVITSKGLQKYTVPTEENNNLNLS